MLSFVSTVSGSRPARDRSLFTAAGRSYYIFQGIGPGAGLNLVGIICGTVYISRIIFEPVRKIHVFPVGPEKPVLHDGPSLSQIACLIGIDQVDGGNNGRIAGFEIRP